MKLTDIFLNPLHNLLVFILNLSLALENALYETSKPEAQSECQKGAQASAPETNGTGGSVG